MNKFRQRVGYRNHTATFNSPVKTLDSIGQEEITWTLSVQGWYCELLTVSSGEVVRGRQTRTNTTKVLFGNYSAVKDVDTSMQCVISGKVYNVNSVIDQGGNQFEMRIELKESN